MIVSPWRGANPQRTTGSLLRPELWSTEIMKAMFDSMKLTADLVKEAQRAERMSMVRIKPHPTPDQSG